MLGNYKQQSKINYADIRINGKRILKIIFSLSNIKSSIQDINNPYAEVDIRDIVDFTIKKNVL